ncbi:PREDICTED: subtilisin-like protease SBT4.15 [Nelumbo nucifera]|uniref:Subtilisin-like protease SBT4.15 n=2 Tax=Nelumbo nucifera TaxID=4432 RepID=A0A1U7YTZ5_NELNU|nr:PREDICTED: subtilisin-like protease SBT4.15 [Nelumbo nucifera]DAD28778.1 TPA_asm: hypothetical protein HUJ06_030246 [Nelumbo nucifera]
MRISEKLLLAVLINLCLVATSVHGSASNTGRQPYIVYMGDVQEHGFSVEQHHNMLTDVIGDESIARESRLHSYKRSFNGFAAMLLPHEANRLMEREGVVSVFPNTKRKLVTTRSWDFLGMPLTVNRNHQSESDIIVGLLDTGVYPESPSFDDKGYGPPPSKWKGKCEVGANFTGCNNKLIGARSYSIQIKISDQSPADTEGHGTHTSSTVAGSAVNHASLYGIGRGTTRGGVPSARIAMYKVCWYWCSDIDILAAFDDVISDGVDVLSISIGGSSIRNYFNDSLAIGSFHAMKKGIFTACAAGNQGPYALTVSNVAPWIMTVGATGIDRKFRTEIRLGNGMKIYGLSLNTYAPTKQMYPLTSGTKAANYTDGYEAYFASSCYSGTMGQEKVEGKIVYCASGQGMFLGDRQDHTVKELGGVGTIIAGSELNDTAFSYVLPASRVDLKSGDQIDRYINTTKNPQAIIYKTKEVKVSAPFVASFSSRGPNYLSPRILKPDITAPGVDILAAYTKLASVTGQPYDDRFSLFNIVSGTSMACPHAAAAAAYVKSFHPNWSPAAIKSALMTTATAIKVRNRDAEFAYGSGHINPVKALNPGLVYDLQISSYIRFLCREGYNSTNLHLITGWSHLDCQKFQPARGHDGINYPTMTLPLPHPAKNFSAVFKRIVTNVGTNSSVYKATVKSPEGLSISVFPNTLAFNRVYQRKTFKVVIKGKPLRKETPFISASLEWSDSIHRVRSPIVVYKISAYRVTS